MAARKSATTKAQQQAQRVIDDLDRRRQKQIENQIATIDRLLEGGTYAGEMAALHRSLAETQARLDEALARLAEADLPLEPPAYTLGSD